MKKELFYIRGNAERADEVKAALLKKYPYLRIDPQYTKFMRPDWLYYNHNGAADYVEPKEIATMDLLKACGTELHLPEKETQEQEFNVGDVVTRKDSDFNLSQIVTDTKDDNIHVSRNMVIVNGNNNYRLATDKEIGEWNKEVLHPKGLHYSKDKRKFEYWFLPFDKVLVRYDTKSVWRCGIFSNFIKEIDMTGMYPLYMCVGDCYKLCIPYNEKTAHLLGSTDAYEEEEL